MFDSNFGSPLALEVLRHCSNPAWEVRRLKMTAICATTGTKDSQGVARTDIAPLVEVHPGPIHALTIRINALLLGGPRLVISRVKSTLLGKSTQPLDIAGGLQ